MQALTIPETCERLKIGRSTFYDHVKRGNGPRITKIGNRSVVFDDDLKAWVESLRSDRASVAK
jgi:excisionase family DNA binding protein